MKKSLASQLMINVGIPIAVVIFIVGIATYFSAKDEINEVYNSQLITSANVLWLMNQNKEASPAEITMKSENTHLDDSDQQALDEYAKWRAFRLWKQGKLLVYSDNSQGDTTAPSPKGFTDIMVNGESWRIFTLYVPEEQTIVEVAEDGEARSVIIEHILFSLILPLLIAIPIIVVLIWKGIQWGLRDLRRFAIAIKQRSPDNLSRLSNENTPEEIKPLAQSVNHLLEKLQSSMAQERLFTDNAAHELRTPLAVLGIQADVVLHSQKESEREHAVLELAKGVRRASRMVEQLLTMARIHQQPIGLVPLNLYDQTREAVKIVYPNVLKKNIELSLSGDETIEIHSQRALLVTLLTNILDNAVKYTPSQGEVRIMIAREHGVPMLTVEDTGPGIPPEEYENVFKRFYRIPGSQEIGSGLGLAIVHVIAELVHATINLYAPEKSNGLGIKCCFR